MRFRIIAAVAAGAFAALTAVPAASASAAPVDSPRTFSTTVTGTCATATGEWVLDWAITNESDASAMLISVSSTPSDHRAEDLPSGVAANTTVRVKQHIPGDTAAANLSYIALWTNEWPAKSFMSRTDFTAPGVCAKA